MPRRSAYHRFLPSVAVALIMFFLAVVAGAVPSALAQNPAASAPVASAQQPAAQKPNTQNPEDQGPAETLKLSVNVVGVFFNVKDKHGALMPNLTKEDFEVFEDGKPQTIKYFAAESN